MTLFAPNPSGPMLNLPHAPLSPTLSTDVASDLVNNIGQIQDLGTLQSVLQQVVNQANVIANQAANPNLVAAKQYLEMQLAQSIATTNATQGLLQNLLVAQSQPCFGAVQGPQAQQAAFIQALVPNAATNPMAATSLSNVVGPAATSWNLPNVTGQDGPLPFRILSVANNMVPSVPSPLVRTASDRIAASMPPSAPFSFPHDELSRAPTLASSHISSPVEAEEGPKAKFLGFDGLGSQFRTSDTSAWSPPKGFAPSEAAPRSYGASGQCVHGRQRSRCKDCGGSGICEHNKRRSMCKQCGGSQICQHQRQRSQCKDCGGASICEHNCLRSRCKDCGGASICEHKKRWRQCKECGTSEVCAHKKRKALCKECCNL